MNSEVAGDGCNHAYRLKILRIIAKARQQNPKSRYLAAAELKTQICDLLNAVGINHDDSEYSRSFREAVAARKPDHKKLAQLFFVIARAETPLSLDLLAGDAQFMIESQLRGHWPGDAGGRHRHLETLLKQPETASTADVERIRRAAEQLRQYHASRVRRGAPVKTKQFTLLIELAEIFARAIGHPDSRFSLPSARHSQFIQFVSLVLQPYFPSTEVGPEALAKYWARTIRQQVGKRPKRSSGPPRKALK